MTRTPVREDQRLRGSERHRREGDALARDVLRVTQVIAAWRVANPARIELDVCGRCGSLERADRACQVCTARRAAA